MYSYYVCLACRRVSESPEPRPDCPACGGPVRRLGAIVAAERAEPKEEETADA